VRWGIAGGAGFVGVNLARALLRAGHEVVLVDRGDRLGRLACSGLDAYAHDHDLATGPAAELAAVDVVVNLAALAHVDYSLHFAEQVLANNVDVQRNVLEAAAEHRIPVVFTSSIEVYGGNHGDLFDESSPRLALSPYAESKILGEDLLARYRDERGVRATVVRLTNLYGPWQAPDRIVPRVVTQAQSGLKSQITLGRVRDFLHVDDAVAAILGLVGCGVWDGCFNVSAGTGVALDEVAGLIADCVPACSYTSVDNVLDSGRGRYLVASADRLGSVLNWRPTVGLAEGLASTVDWYGHNRAWWSGFDGLLRAERAGPEFLVDAARPLRPR
jgi:dTDP-glucose 4,6-dehydratase